MAFQGNPSFYPGGFGAGLVVRNMPLLQTYPGVVWWVSNNATLPGGISSQRIPFVNGSDGNKGTWNAPFATLTQALSVASNNDIIMVKPGHAETVAAAAGIVINKGVAIVGLGSGAARPTFTFSTATSTITVTANNASVQNLLHLGGAASTFVATAYSIANAQVATHFTVESCEFRDVDATHGFVACVKVGTTANIADGLRFANNKVFRNLTSPPAANTAVVLASNIDRMEFEGNYIVNSTANNNIALGIAGGALAMTNVSIRGNRTRSLNTGTTAGELLSSSSTACSGLVSDNYVQHLAATGLIAPTGTKLGFAQNFCAITGTADTNAIINPAVA